MMYVTSRSILLYIVVSTIHSIFVNGRITTAPKDTEVLDRHSTYFNCSSSIYDKYINWFFYPVGGTGIDRKYIYFSGRMYNPYVGRFQIDISANGVCNLVILSAMMQDAGRYDCQDDGGIGETKSAQLIVLATNPLCKSDSNTTVVLGRNSCGIEPDQPRLSCSVTYKGNIPPVMEWKSVEGNVSLIHYTGYVKEGNVIIYNLTLNANSHRSGSSYSCHTTRSTTPTQYNCTSDIFNIAYSFSDNLTVNASVDERVICAANTSEVCDYTWKRFVAGSFVIQSHGSTLAPKTSGWYRCDAECNIKNRLCSFSAMTAYVFEKEGNHVDLKTILIPVIATLLLLLGVIVAVIFYVQKLKKKRINERNRLQQAEDVVVEIRNGEMYFRRPGSSLVGVYGIDIESIEFTLRRKWSIKDLNIDKVAGLVGSTDGSHLYILDNKNELKNCEIIKIDTEGKFLSKWATEYKGDGALSTTYDDHIILCTWRENKLIEYSSEGVIIREITNTCDDVLHPWFSKKLPIDEYMASYKYVAQQSDIIKFKIKEDELEEKHLTVGKENLIGHFRMRKRRYDSPSYFNVDKDGSIYLPDETKDRIVIFDSEFKNQTPIEGVIYPLALWLDELQDAMFVWGVNGISVIKLSSKVVLRKLGWPEDWHEPPN